MTTGTTTRSDFNNERDILRTSAPLYSLLLTGVSVDFW